MLREGMASHPVSCECDCTRNMLLKGHHMVRPENRSPTSQCEKQMHGSSNFRIYTRAGNNDCNLICIKGTEKPKYKTQAFSSQHGKLWNL
uniref:Uncharacterized protein n=1 Tax=Rhizophora mucronata TaxID=61149 RepID=A0A2P2P3P8_RHIMU